MASNSGKLRVWVATENEAVEIDCSSNCTAEDLCINLCKKYNISPLTRPLFALRIKGTNYFLKDNSTHLYNTPNLELRIRFKIPRLNHLITLDEHTYDYYFRQVRNDVNDHKIPEIRYPDHKNELLGLGITDMYRAYLEEHRSLNDVEKNYKIYVPKVIIKKHGGIPKKCAKKSLPILCRVSHPINYVKGEYLQQVYSLAPNYLSEEFKDVIWTHNGESQRVNLHVAPFHGEFPGLRLFNICKNEWFHVCPIEDLIYLTRNGNQTVEVSRRGTPLFFQFKCEEELDTFISVCDGYYRLMVKWIFNLSKDDETPSLKELNRLKCHGPVGGAFSYRKLEEKRGKKHGCFILRQCQDDYNVYYLDVCTKNSTTTTYKVEFRGDCYVFNDEKYDSLDRLISSHKNPEGMIYLNECIPASEYDKSQLLLCGESLKKGVRIEQADLQEILKDNRSPRCLSTKDILIYTGSEKFGRGRITTTHTALWKLDETRKMKVAFKTLQKEKANEYFKDFIELASSWACVQSSMVVRLYGITLASPTALVLEYLHYGPFDRYLKENGNKIEPIHLKKVAAGIARALWDLSEAGLVHGYIRCHKLLLAAHDDTKILVKLTGPSLRRYDDDDIHWIPVEFFSDKSLVRRSVYGDIWAFATTMWEMFSYGVSPNDLNPKLTAKSYELGDRLLRPARCPSEVWTVVWGCWTPDAHGRPRPQEIMRDMSRLLHAEYIPPYDEPKFVIDDKDNYDVGSVPIVSGSMKSSFSISDSSLPSESADNHSSKSLESMNGLPRGLLNTSWSDLPELADEDCRPPSRDSWGHPTPRLMECIVSQGKTYLVTLHKKIGSGNYGNVYKGWMESDNQESQRREVAIKKLTRQESERNGNLYDDFKNELEIMKSLQHVNVVEILGYSWEPGNDVLIVMEYLEEGSLHQYLKFTGDKLNTHHLLKYALDIATGMDHISAKNVVHRDLATRNILVVNKTHVKISDFGLARMLTKDESAYKIKTERGLPLNWYAPESAGAPWLFSTASDVWSYGVTVWEIFTRAAVDVPKFDLERPDERASCFQIPDGCPSEIYRDLMKKCWNLDQSQRPKFITLVHSCKRFIAEYKNHAFSSSNRRH